MAEYTRNRDVSASTSRKRKLTQLIAADARPPRDVHSSEMTGFNNNSTDEEEAKIYISTNWRLLVYFRFYITHFITHFNNILQVERQIFCYRDDWQGRATGSVCCPERVVNSWRMLLSNPSRAYDGEV